ncbi:MAG: carboxypeptidase-like regulatory domain-containing protein [Bacteroidales bacterium]|nr:carboxypeptidase-like regulatory domain-containing protein [Bacteroidales bacterium]
MKRLFLALAAAFALSPGFAQDVSQKAGDGDDVRTLLTRGQVSRRYSFFTFNGTPYIDTLGFVPGVVIFNGVKYNGVFLNYDALEQEIGVKTQKDQVSVTPIRDQVSWFERAGRRYVNLNYLGVKNAPAGFFEVVYDGDQVLLTRTEKNYRSVPGNYNGTRGIGYDDPNYNTSLINYYTPIITYWTLDGNTLTKLRARPFKKTLKRLYSEEETGSLKERASIWRPTETSDLHYEAPSLAVKKPNVSFYSLPEGFFREEISEDAAYADSLSDAIRAMYQNKIYEIGDASRPKRSKAVVSGTVTDAVTGEPLPDVSVWDDNTKTYCMTDGKGHYSLSVPVGENVINLAEPTKQDMRLKVLVHNDGSLDVTMTERVTMLNSAMISADSRMSHRTARMGLEKVSIKTINKIPSAFGEGDVLKAVLTLPGVKSVGEASGGFNVRGGSSDQNLILFNEGTIYNPSHMFGVFSAFNPDVIEGVDLMKSSIPAEYGGRVSSVLEVKGKEGSMEKVKGSLGVGLMTSRFHLEGPLKKGKTSFLLGGRTTYSDWMLKRIKSANYNDGSADFSDANFGLSHRPDSLNNIVLSGYWSRDNFSFSPDTTFRYKSLNGSLKWTHKGRGKTSFAVSAGVDMYGNILEETPHFSEFEAYSLTTEINQAFFRLKFDTKAGPHTVTYGTELLGYGLAGGHISPFGEGSAVIDRTLGVEYAIQPSLHLGDVWTLGEKFMLDYGARLSSFYSMESGKTYAGPEFRLSWKYSATPDFSLKAGVNTMRQYIHLISNTTTISPMDTWKLCDEKLLPVQGWQAAGGMYWTVFNGAMDLSVEGYWKNVKNSLDYKSGATLVMNENLADDLVRTRGKAYGVEFMAKKTVGKLSGWLSYTYSRTLLQEMEDRGVNTINGGDWYPAPYDKPHDFKLVANLAMTARYSLSANVDYSTGRPVTVPVGFFYYGGGYRLAYSERNSYRIPDYFRLDLALNIDPGHYLKALTHFSFSLGCYNVTGRKNTYSVFYNTDQGRGLQGYRVCVFATQVPYVNFNILF